MTWNTHASAGIDKNLAHRARSLAEMTEEEFAINKKALGKLGGFSQGLSHGASF